MKTTDLRIGNYIQKKDEVCVLASINTDDTIRIFNEDKTDTFGCFCFRIFNPIPLTEEWLLKFGFTEKLGNLELPNFRFHINKPMNFDGFIFCEGYSVITDKIQFVHQLQNLYFALTQTELTLS